MSALHEGRVDSGSESPPPTWGSVSATGYRTHGIQLGRVLPENVILALS